MGKMLLQLTTLVVIFNCYLFSLLAAKPVDMSDDQALAYLERLQYAGENSPDPRLKQLAVDDPAEALREALITFQTKWQLDVTGELTADTIDLMQVRRCGLPDINTKEDLEPASPNRRYVLTGYQWEKTDITYHISGYTSDLTETEIDSAISLAFRMWEDVTPLRFTRQDTGLADIDIFFATGEHGDGLLAAFDGPGYTLAHAFFPTTAGVHYIDGDAHFDDDETWAVGFLSDYVGTNLFQVAAHEFGHSLGIDHSEVNGTVMYPYYYGYDEDYALHDDDIAAVQSLYGEPEDDRYDGYGRNAATSVSTFSIFLMTLIIILNVYAFY